MTKTEKWFRLLGILFFVFIVLDVFAQKGDSIEYSFNASLELNTKYVWRGVPFGNAPTLFPSIGFQYKNFGVSAFGGYAFNGSHSEVDWFFTYQLKNITFGLGDYFFPVENITNNHYLNFKSKETFHTVELYATYSPAKLPFWVTASSFIFGNDRKESGINYYSSYFETGWYKQFSETDKFSLLIGITPAKGFYADGFNLVNTAIKYETAIQIGNFKLPVSGAFVLNPASENVFLTFSAYLFK